MVTATYTRYPLIFKNPSGTSRGILHEKQAWFLRLEDEGGRSGTGEVSWIPGLSRSSESAVSASLDQFCLSVNRGDADPRTCSHPDPGIGFALECALLDLDGEGNQLLFPSPFSAGEQGIPINGLIWMGEPSFMKQQISEKLERGFTVLKMKVGALDTGSELEILSWIRSTFGSGEPEIRLDANGAWSPREALLKIEQFAPFGIHSLEQPIGPGQWEEMERICSHSPVPVALDEELIGLDAASEGTDLLDAVRPHYLILKPGLLGGFGSCDRWIAMARDRGIGWWATSALESSVGLNAIAQWTFLQGNPVTHGLGTGSIYRNNIPAPLEVRGERLWHAGAGLWDLSGLSFGHRELSSDEPA